ncbi:MAG: coproporphyrinogen oxidase [Caulobacteraceae bacterium]|nr:coproporphyrinogen oxidase [Caulobacteraceae bacterium]
MTAPNPLETLGVYIHWPYCARICPYCDFNVVRDRGRPEQKAALTAAILADLKAHAALTGPRRLVSIFFGGGTPSLMDPTDVGRLIEAARALWTPADDLEITLEANPTDAEADRFAALSAAGVNRLSLGVQSLDDAALGLLGRNHDARAARRAIEVARAAFARLSVDLIYALPGQDLAAWADELSLVAGLGAEHISPYQLTIEPGAAFHRRVQRGNLVPLDADRAADFYETTQSVLGGAGFEAYEVSNHARGRAARSRHNLIYWRGEDYVGVGPGAHGRLTLEGQRFAAAAPDAIIAYVEQVRRAGTGSPREPLAPREVALERLLMGLRTVEGVPIADLAPLAIPASRLESLDPLVRRQDGRLVATPAGRPVLDRVIAELVAGG